MALRNELHESIYDEVTGTEYKALRVLREPNQSKKQPAPKLIVVVKTVEQAQALKDKCFSLIASTNESIKRQLKDSAFLHYEIKYSINIINSESDILLSVRDAQRRKKMDGEKIKSKLQISHDDLVAKQKVEHEHFNAETDKYESDIKNMEDCINTLVDDTDYIFAESTGNSYRITYFDGECRKQISAGNLLIVVNSSNIQILDAPIRKQRSDKKDCLYYLKTAYDTICIYMA